MSAEPLVTNVSDTARGVAVYRAWESARPDALFKDPYADRLAGERGRAIAAPMPRQARSGWPMVIRTLLMDELIAASVREGCDRVRRTSSPRPWAIAVSRSSFACSRSSSPSRTLASSRRPWISWRDRREAIGSARCERRGIPCRGIADEGTLRLHPCSAGADAAKRALSALLDGKLAFKPLADKRYEITGKVVTGALVHLLERPQRKSNPGPGVRGD